MAGGSTAPDGAWTLKVKINGTDREARHAIAAAICARTDAAAVHQVGKIIVLWRPTPEDDSASPSEVDKPTSSAHACRLRNGEGQGFQPKAK